MKTCHIMQLPVFTIVHKATCGRQYGVASILFHVARDKHRLLRFEHLSIPGNKLASNLRVVPIAFIVQSR